ncbi:calcium-activated chloride channel regulator 3A-1-like [Amblyomma americanum]
MSGMFCFTAVLLLVLTTGACVELDESDGGYNDLRVSISENVPHDDTIIANIKTLLRSASEFLHKATYGRVYFKHATIEVPMTWPKRRSARAVSSSAFYRSDVPEEQHGDKPFTAHMRSCGQSGGFIHLTPRFLATLDKSAAYVFVHEWAHFRYGVFDEYGSLNDSKFPFTYCRREDRSRTVVLNACSSRIVLEMVNNGKPCTIDTRCNILGNCNITIQQPTRDPVESSIMFMPYVDKVSQFCEGMHGRRSHNTFAPNKQNEYCNRRPTWDVISKHEDFKNLPRPDMSKRIEMTFDEVQRDKDLPERVVLVLDTSTSMEGSRIDFLKEATERYIADITDGSRRLAIVTFSSVSTVVHTLKTVNVNTKQEFVNAIKNFEASGATCIGCGLETALGLLRSGTETPEGAFIALLTDGEENRAPFIAHMVPEIVASKAVVSTMALGDQAASMLEVVPTLTRGKAFAISDLRGNVRLELERAFVSSTTTQADHIARTYTLLAADEKFTDELETKFHVDATVGNSTVVYVSQNHPEQLRIDASLIDPENQPCQGCQKTTKGKEITITIPSTAMVGNWTLRLTSPSPSPVEVNVRAETKRRGKDEEVIRVSCEMSYLIVDKFDKAVIYAKVTKGSKPVVDAVVVATVYRPGDTPHAINIPLYDDAEMPDVGKNDGTYSGYFTQFTGRGRYTVMAVVSTQETTRLAKPLGGLGTFFTTSFLHGMSEAATGTSFESASKFQVSMFEIIDGTTEDTTADRVDDFQRVASGGCFQVTEHIVEEDVPPGRIWDLAVEDVRPGEYLKLLVELTWTWPGAHLTSGMASGLEIRVSKHYAGLEVDFGNQAKITEADVVEGNLDPQPSRSRHNVTLSIPRPFSSLRQDGALKWQAYLAAQVVNSQGLKSDISTVVEVLYDPSPVTTTMATTTTTTGPPTTDEAPKESTQQKSDFFASPLFWVALSCIASVTVIAIVVAVLGILNRREQEEPYTVFFFKNK